MNDDFWPALAARLARERGISARIERVQPVPGGDTSLAWRLTLSGLSYFVKCGPAPALQMFAAEAEGLAAINATATLRCPRPLWHGVVDARACLVLEYLSLSHHGKEAALGERLAQLHRHTGPHYGWHRNNTIGATPQDNRPMRDWTRFWYERRLAPQLRMAADHGAPRRLMEAGDRLLARLPALLDGHAPPAALLHGDLWGGNHAYDADGNPVIFDPAPYYGDRETDLAMTELFGGFGASFRAAYESVWPLPGGYESRKHLYNLYHVLNHYNLFGDGYAGQAQRLIENLLNLNG